MADAATSTVVNKLTELAGQELRLLQQVVKDVKFLTDKFEWLQALLNDADQQRRTSKNPFVALWVRQGRDTAFAVEDVLDEFSRKVEKAKLSGYGWKAVLKFQWAADCFTGVWVTHGLSGKIEDIKAKLQELDTNRMTYNIELNPSSSSWTPSFKETISIWNLSIFERTAPFMSVLHISSISILISMLIGVLYKTFYTRKKNSKSISSHTTDEEFTKVDIYTSLVLKQHNCKLVLAKFYNASSSFSSSFFSLLKRGIIGNNGCVYLLLKRDHQDSDAPVGLESKVQELKNLLLQGGRKKKVISIIDQNGSGRSLLAKTVYNDSEIQSYFEAVAWKNLPLKFRLTETFSDIYWKVAQKDCKQDDIGKELRHLLRKKPYLIVLNGIDRLEDWKNLSTCLPDKKKGSRVILIPRIGSEVARLSKTEGITVFTPKPAFSTDESSALFGQKFFDKISYPSEYGPYIRQIHDVTRGHPMSIVLLAGLLRSKEVSHWEKVFQLLKDSREAYPIDTMLSLSFDDLPHQLKSCFLYFAAQPQSTGFEVNVLVRIWVAEGFIQPTSGKTLEEVGEGYLKELISRSLVRIDEEDKFGGATVVSVDDQIYAFLQSEAHESSFVEIHDNADLVFPAKIRQLSIQNYTHNNVQVKNSLPKMRSLLCDCSEEHSEQLESHRMKFLLESKFLRVIDLHGLIIDKLPGGIGTMIHLRYLGICCIRFQELPCSISKLRNLQTLDIRKSSVQKISDSFWKIPTLRHVLSDGIKLPEEIGELNNLQTLQIADCTRWNHSKQLLEKISNIRILNLMELSTPQAEKVSKSLSNLGFLRHLSLKAREGHSIPSKIFTISSLRCLRSMELHGLLSGLDELLGDKAFNPRYNLPNLINLTFTMSNLQQRFIKLLSVLPSLSQLYLRNCYNGKNIDFLLKKFQNLEELEISGLNALEEWNEITRYTLPKLKKLILSGCTNLRSLPKGLQNLGLEEVVIYNMDNIINDIRNKTGENYEKIKHVKTIKIR